MNLILKYRLMRGWTQAELGAKTGLDPARISQYENGLRIPDAHLAGLKQALDIPRSEFVHLISDRPEKKKPGRKGGNEGIVTWLRIPPDLHEKLKLEASEKNIPITQLILSKLT